MKNQIPFKYALNDILFASAENMIFVKITLKKEFVIPLKAKSDTKLNHFALKSKLYLSAIQSAYATLRNLNPTQLAA